MSFCIREVLIPVEDAYAIVDVQITGDRIESIGKGVSASSVTISGTDKLLLPGFVNAHTHSSQIWQRGLIPQLPLELWLADVFDAGTTDPEIFYLGALSTAIDTILSGGTCVVDHVVLASNHELESLAEIVRAYKEVGIRAVIAPLIQDLPFVAGLPAGLSLPHPPSIRNAADILALMEELIQQFHQPDAGIYIAVGPTGFHRCSDKLLEGCAELSDRYDLCRHMHLLETKTQQRLADERYGGSAVKHLQQLGFLDRRTSLAHGVWLTEADIEILAATQSTVVHNPVSNLRLGSGIAPVLKCLKAGVNVSFGCDGAASNDGQDLLEAIKLGTILHTITEPDYQHWLTPRQAIEMATLGGATGINLSEQIGTLTVGKQADLVLYDLTHLSLLPHTDLIQLLVLGRPTQVVNSVWVQGQKIVAEGKVQTIDIEQLRQALLDRSRHADKPLFQTIQQIEPHYRRLLDRN